MDGKSLLRKVRQLLAEGSDTGWLDDYTTYDYLYEAAKDLVDRTGCLRTYQDITTVADTQVYDLNPDFLRLYLRNPDNELYVRLYDTSNYHWPIWKDYEDIIWDNNTTSIAVPPHFTIVDVADQTQVTGTATSAGDASAGECTLTDTAADYSDVDAGAIVHNTTDGSDGVVLSKTSSTVLVTALFGGTGDDWDISDAYVIQPQSRCQLYLDSPASTAGYTIRVYYVQQPEPVYSDYGVYRFSDQYTWPLVNYAAFLYKYRDGEPDYGDAFYMHYERGIGKTGHSINRGQRPTNFKVNLKKRQ